MQGRCAGCEKEGPYKAVLSHVQRCAKFAELYRTDPVRALDPADEFRRVAADRKPEPVVVKPPAPRPVAVVGPAIVAAPKQSPRRERKVPAGVVEPVRVAGPVAVEYWVIPRGLLDTGTVSPK